MSVAGVLAAAGSIAYASIPDGGGVIHGCYSTLLSKGQLRVVDTDKGEACKPGERSLN
jgi:hypothetical protein